MGNQAVGNLSRAVDGAVAEVAPWIGRLARLGYAAKAVLYATVGILALRVAAGDGGRTTGSRGALREVLAQPFGAFLVALMAAGLFGYALWRAVEALTDAEGHGDSFKAIAIRASYLFRGVVHAALGLEAVRLLEGRRSGGGEDQMARHWTARALAEPAGEWLVWLAAAGVLGYGLYQIYRGAAGDVTRRLALGALGAEARRWVVRVSRFGIAARGVVFTMMGVFLVRAALQQDPGEASGVAESLRALARNEHGPWLLGAVAAGLIAYGIDQAVHARFRRLRGA